MNLFVYAYNDPVNSTDPFGLDIILSDPKEVLGIPSFTEYVAGFFSDPATFAELTLVALAPEIAIPLLFGTSSSKSSIRWCQKSQRWRNRADLYTKGPKMKKGFGKPSTWKQGTKEVANEMIAGKAGKEAYDKAVQSAIQDEFAGAFEQVVKSLLKKK